MLRLLVDGARGPCLEEVAVPAHLPGQVLIRTEFSLVSPGTERHYVAQCRETGEQLRLGYCVAGVVEQVGRNVPDAVKSGRAPFMPGDRVIGMGWSHACHAQYVAVPHRLVCAVPDYCDLKDAVFANLMATAVHAVDRGMVIERDRVLVVGAGLLGHLVAEVCASITADVTLSDRHSRTAIGRRQTFELASVMTSEPGAWAGRFTKAFICIAGDATEWLKILPVMLNARGNEQHRPRIVGVGRYTAQMSFSVEMGNIDMVFAARCGEGYRNDQYVHGQLALEPLPGEATVDTNLQRALALIANERVHVRHLVSSTIGIDDLPSLYETRDPSEPMLGVIVGY